MTEYLAFQCRSRLCLWCKTVAHSPCISCVQRLFWKVSGCLRWLSERMQNTYSNTTSLSGAIPCAISPCHAHGRIGKSRRCSAALRRIPATFHFVLCTIYIIAETAPNDKYLRPRKKASARGAADTSYGTNHRTVLKQDFLLRPLYRFLRQEEPSIPGKPILQMFRLSSPALR